MASATVMVSTTATAVVTVSPGQAAVASSGTATFSASVQCSANTAVSWSCSGGNIDQAGHYTAPATGGIYTVPATSQAASGAVGAATVTVGSGSGAGGTTNATYQYDLDGNLVSGRARTFEWDAEYRLVSVTITATGHVSQFGYDGMGRRVEIQEMDPDTTQTLQVTSDKKYLWDGLEIAEERDTTGGIVLRRFYNQGFVDSDGTVLFYTRDHLGSIRELTDGTQAIRARYDYDPWGRPTQLQGDRQAPFQYAGYFWHAPSGLDLTMCRAYDPNLGRWTSRDPIEENGGINLYGYVANIPSVLMDPFGLVPQGFMDPENERNLIPLEGGGGSGIGGGPTTSGPAPDFFPVETPSEGPFRPVAPPDVMPVPKRVPKRCLVNQWETSHEEPWPTDPITGKKQVGHHTIPLADGGPDAVDNFEPMTGLNHTK